MKKVFSVISIFMLMFVFVSCPTAPETEEQAFSGKVKVTLDVSSWDAGGKIAVVEWKIFPLAATRSADAALNGRVEVGEDGKAELCILDVRSGAGYGWSLKAYDADDVLLDAKSGKLKPDKPSVELFSASFDVQDSRMIKIMVKDPVDEYEDLASYAMLFNGKPVGEKDLVISGTGETLLLSFPYDGNDFFTWRLLPYSTGMSLPGGSDGILELEEGKDTYWLTPPSVDGLKTDHGLYPYPVKLDLMLEWDSAIDADWYRVTLSGRLSKVFMGALTDSPIKVGTIDYARGAYCYAKVELLKGGAEGTSAASSEGIINAEEGASSFTLPAATVPETGGGGTEEPDVRTVTFKVDDKGWEGLPIKFYDITMNGKAVGRVQRNESGTTDLVSIEVDVSQNISYEVEARDESYNSIGIIKSSVKPDGSGTCTLAHPVPTMWVKEDFIVEKTADGKWNVLDYAGDPVPENITVPSHIAGIAVDAVSGYFPCNGKLAIEDGIRVLGLKRENRPHTIGGKFTSVVVPSSVTKIENNIFSHCESLKTAEINATVSEIPFSAFYGCYNLNSVTLPVGIKTIKSAAFQDCTRLSSVTGATELEVIESDAFYKCNALKDFDFPATLREIYPYAFSYTALEHADLSGLKKLGTGAFKGTCLLTATVPGGLEIVRDPSLGEGDDSGPFAGIKVSTDEYAARRATAFTLTGTWTEVPRYLFSEACLADGFALPDTVAKLGKYAFRAARSNSGEISLPSGIAEIGISSFEGAHFTKIVFPETGLAEIPRDAFYNCKELVTVNIPSSVTAIGDRAFFGCNELAELILPEGLETVGEQAFCGITSVESLAMPDGVTVYPKGMLQSATGLKTFTAGNAVTEVGDYAFHETSIPELVLPETCRNISRTAFAGVKSGTIKLLGLTQAEKIEFSDCTATILYSDQIPTT